MSSPLFDRVRTGIVSRLDLQNDEDQAQLTTGANAILTLDDAVDNVVDLIGEDADLNEVADALLDLADFADDTDITPANRAGLDSIVNRLVKTGTDEQKTAVKALFGAMLDYGVFARQEVAYFDALRQAPPKEA